MNSLYILIFLILLNFTFTFGGAIQCNTFVSSISKANITTCGSSSNDACPTISQSIINCGLYDEITIEITAGNYSIQSETFGPITNKKITISSSENDRYPSPFIDLSNSNSPFIEFVPSNTGTDSLTVSFYGLIFGGIKKSSVLLSNGSGIIDLSVVNCEFFNGKFSSYGSAFTFLNGSTTPKVNSVVTISRSTFYASNSNEYGGFLYSLNLPIQFTINQSDFQGSNIKGGGAIFAISGGFLSVTNTNFKGLETKYPFFLQKKNGTKSTTADFTFEEVTLNGITDGFGILVIGDKNTTIQIKSCTFINGINFSPVFIQGTGQSTIESCTFTNNSNSLSNMGSSAAITISSSSSTINNCNFLNNRARFGGAIATDSCDPQGVTITNSIFQGNDAEYDGGSIFNNKCNVTIKNVDFSNLPTNISTIYCESSNMAFTQTNIFEGGKLINDLSSSGIVCDLNPCNIIINSNQSVICQSSSNNNNNDDGLSTGKKVLIAFGVIAAFIIIITIVVVIFRSIKRNKRYKPVGY
ncbi:hypothetical protein RB653_000081 [Dictyostelium firmibasis]|uniref:Right handed beta helix domain-containing protein n=1 Tax=Dictyostelium firmibasis TaxID=79012 RepID=A0AAN7UEU9_9MYCE